jgi:hypothetical protein
MNYKLHFNPSDCNNVYFEELLLLLNKANIEKETYKRIKPDAVSALNIKCQNTFNNCKTDEFFFENKKQIILGRFFDTVGCFYKCKGHYFSMAMEPYSLFKNDLFIRYIIDKPHLYINNSKKIELEDVFPIRVVLSNIHQIPTHVDTKIINMNEYIYDSVKKQYGISDHNMKLIDNLPKKSILRKIITERFPINHIISRELCILFYMKLNFYVVENEDKTLKPFILISKYKLKHIKNLYKNINKPFPNIKYLFDNNNKIKQDFVINR